MPSLTLIEDLAITLTQLTLITNIVLVDITLHLRLQCLNNIVFELLFETQGANFLLETLILILRLNPFIGLINKRNASFKCLERRLA